MAKVLLIDGDTTFLSKAREALESRNHRVSSARTLNLAIDRLKRHHPDLIIIDPSLNDSEGYEACRSLRLETAVPILVVAENGEEIDKVVAFELGADDYMTKPVSMRELQARVAARLRHAAPGQKVVEGNHQLRTLSAGGLTVDLARRAVTKHGRVVALRHKEFELLALLMRNKGRTVSRADVLREVWGYQAIGSTRTVDVHVERLRKKIEDDPTVPAYVLTERGVGYRFEG